MQEEKMRPPYSNTGVQNTSKSTLTALVDWVSVTFKFVQDPRKIIDLFCLSDVEFTETRGLNGYPFCLRHNNISFHYGATDDMGVHVIMSGQGCREYEQLKTLTWSELFKTVLEKGGHFTQLHLALDDIATGDNKLYFNVRSLKQRIRKGLCKSRMKRVRSMENILIKDGTSFGETLYFGSPSSEIQIVFYEKDYERMAKSYNLEADVLGWNRTEVRLGRNRADSVAGMICSGNKPLGLIVRGILSNYINFISEQKNDTNKSRINIAPFWKRFLDDADPIKIAEKAPDSTIEKKELWIDKAVKKSLAMTFIAKNADMNYIEQLIREGQELLEEEDLNKILTYQLKQERLNELYSDMRENKKELPMWLLEAIKNRKSMD